MDYKELIDRLAVHGQSAAYIDDSLSLVLEDATTAIETLLAERDAAVNDINELLKSVEEQHCAFCVWQGDCPQEFYSCFENARWRGVQKGSNRENGN